MASIIVQTPPAVEPVSLADIKSTLGIMPWDDSDHVTSAIQATRLRDLMRAAREMCETSTRRAFINTAFIQYLDSFPYYTDTVMSQQAYPPAYYSLPRYSTTLWNYSQMIKLFRSPLVSVEKIVYVGTDQQTHTMQPGTPDNQSGDFVVDTASEPPRVFPNSGQYWPGVLYVPNAVAIYYTAGYGVTPTNVPAVAKTAIRALVKILDKDPGITKMPPFIDRMLWSIRVEDHAPTRG